jgi:hypothetical protein
MASIEIGQLPLTTSVLNNTQIPVENANVTQKIEAFSLKSYMTELPQLTVAANVIAQNVNIVSRLNAGSVLTTGAVTATTLVSTVASGTAPLTVASATQVPNLYASRAAMADTATNGLTTATSFANVAGDVAVAGNSSTLQFTLSTVNTNLGMFGNTTAVPQISVDAKGRVLAVSNIAITFPAQTLISNTAEITANTVSGTPGLLLTATGVTAGTYGGAITVPQITVDTKGRITGLSSIPVNSTLNTLNVGIPIGTIAIWSGALATIPDGWQVADGTNGTRDLRDRFVVGAGVSYVPSATGGTTDSVLVSHTHTATSTSTFAGNSLPTHVHGITDPGHSHKLDGGTALNPGIYIQANPNPRETDAFTTKTAVTGISVNAQTAGIPTGTVATATAINTVGVDSANTNLPPYMALYYIQKMTDSVSINNPINFMSTLGTTTSGGNLVAASGNISISTTTGALVVIGGMGVTGNINVGSGSGNAIVANGNVVINGSLLVASGAGLVPPGGIIAWSGAEINIPTGWLLCNGSNGTPDLRNRFIVGAGTGSSYAVGATGGSANSIVVSHTHTATSTVTDPGHFHNYAKGGASSGPRNAVSIDTSVNTDFNTSATLTSDRGTDTKTTGVTVATTNAATGSSGADANLPPYYALCYIMKA